MSEKRRIVPEPSLEERWNMLDDRFQMQVIDPVGPATADFFSHLRHAIRPNQGYPALKSTIDELWEAPPGRTMEPDRRADYIREFLPRAFAALLLPEDPDFLQDVHWPDVFERLEDQHTRERFTLHKFLPISSNIAGRAIVFDSLLKLHGRRDDVIALELGAGGNNIGKHLALRNPYDRTAAMERVRTGASQQLRENPRLSRSFNQLAASPIHFRRIVGADIFAPTDPPVKNWRMACSLTFEERLDDAKVQQNARLEEANPENVVWQWGDITTYRPVDYRSDYPSEPLPDITFASFVLYLLPKHEQQQGLKNLADFAMESGGIAAVLDDIQSINGSHQPHIIRRNRNFGSTCVWAFDGKHPDDGWLKQMSVRNGRIGAVLYEPGLANTLVYQGLARVAGESRHNRVQRDFSQKTN